MTGGKRVKIGLQYGHSPKDQKLVFKTDYRLMQVLSSFIKLSIVIKIFVLSIFEWPFYTDFTVYEP